MSNMQPAAREGDPIGHTPLLGMIAKVGAGILTGLAVGMAVGAIGLGVAFLTVGTGGIAGVVVGAVVGSIVNQWLDEKTNSITGSNKGLIGFLTDKACAAIDSVIPKEVSGEIVSGSRNVLINNRQAALTGDSGKVACGKHSPLPEAAEGSSRVYINNHLCHRKGDKVCCGGVTMAGSPNVLVGGDSKAECEIADELPWYLQYISKYAGMAIALCTSKGKLLQKVMCLGVNFAISAGADALVHGVWAGMKSAFGGHPVLAATGGKFLDGADDTDFSIAARLAIVWKRTYNSLDKRDDGLFGPGWSTAYGVQLRLHQEGEHPSVYIDERGREVFFPALRPGESAWNASYLCRLAYTPAGDFIVEGADGLYRDFGKPLSAGAHTLNLERLEDRNGNWLSLYFSEAGMLERMADSCGHPLRFVADAKHEGRVAAIETSSPGHEATAAWRTLVSYSYDASGRLATVTNALSHTTRRFSYHDDGPGKDLMASQTLPSGLTCHYQWAMFDHPRVVHTRHSDGRFWAASYDIEKGITRVEDDLGREEEWTWDGDFNPLSHTDALGQVTRLGWNADKQPVSLVKPNGAAWAYEYDEEGLLTKVIDPLGGVATTAWDHLLMQPLVESNAAGQESRYDYDKLGNLIRVTDAAGGVTEYGLDGYGQVCAITDPLDNIIRLVWNEEGRLARHIDCSGGETVYAYDAFGHLAVVTDAEGQASRYVNDALGRVTTLTTPDGGQRGIEWDAAGQMAAFTDALGHTSRYAYNQRGQLSQVTNAIGQGRSYSYDDAGNLYTLGNENGEEYVFRHDALDRRVAQAGLDGLRTEWSLDANGLPVLTRQAADREGEIRTVLTRDVLGRLIRKTTAETRTDYSYDPLGWVTRISRAGLDGAAIDDIAFAYDALGNLIEEKTTANGKSRSLKHSYDPLGNRVQTILPDGRVLSFSFCGTGFLGQVATAEREGDLETVISAIERDQLHRETLRGQGKRQARSSWDPLSRLSQRRSALRLNIGDILPGIDEVVPDIKKEFTYDHNGELSHRIDSFSGYRGFAYDALGRINKTTAKVIDSWELRNTVKSRADIESLFAEEEFAYDAASNLLSGTDNLPVTVYRPNRPSDPTSAVFGEARKPQPVRHNRLQEYNGLLFKYDMLGRVIEKNDQDRRITWNYKYNCESQLVETTKRSRDGFTRVRFTYDALGRRISKSDGTNETRFFWDGMRLLQEECKGLTSTYLYEQDSYVPLARLDQAEHEKEPRIYYFHCNASGQPEEMTDVDGRLVWRGRYSTWGKVVFETVTRHTPRAFSQNLRMQGQYDDRETGLCYNTFRYYDPDIGRFTSEDPIGLLGGINLYQYAPNPLAWIDPWGWNTTPYSEAPKVIGYENHHVIQDAAVKNLSGYNPDAAPTTPLKGPASMVGTQHHAATQVQRNTILGGTYGAERKVAFKALVAAEHTPREAVKIIHSADNYFNSIGVTKDTATRVPKNRPNPKRGAGCI